MAPIPLAPLRPSKPGDRDQRKDGKRRPGRIRRSMKYVVSPFGAWVGAGAIRSSAEMVGAAVREARAAAKRDPRFMTFPDGRFDYEATAFLFGISVHELQCRLSARRRQTAYLAYGCLAAALVSFGLWISRAFGATPVSTMYTLNAFSFGAICMLAAFYQALVNFQLRSARAASWREFLLTEQDFWPSL